MGRKKEPRLFTLDAETDPFSYGRIPKPFVWGLYGDSEFKHFWGADCTRDLLDYLADEKNIIIYAHNGGKFDYHFLLNYLDPDLSIINGRISRATLFNGAIELRDSYLILPLPLAAHEKDSIDYGKMESDRRETHKTEIIDYLKTDCVSLWDWVTKFRREFGTGLTLAGTAFEQLKKTDYEIGRTHEGYDDQFRNFYFGGRVQCFETGSHYGDLKYYDINSAYPWAMTLPHWYGSSFTESKTLDLDNENGSWFAEIVAVSRGALPMRGDDGKLYFPDDNVARTFLAGGWEILAGIATGTLSIQRVLRVYSPVFKNDFNQYVEKFFRMKKEAEEKGDSDMRLFAKLFLNSCYGKFGQDGRRFEKFTIVEKGRKPDDKFKWTLYSITDNCWIYSRPDPSHNFFNVATAASITSCVRAFLWRSICDADTPIYTDTDSIICRAFNGRVGNNLGEWALEAEATEAHVAQRKMYAMRLVDGSEKVASKGVRLSFDQIKRGVTTGESIMHERDAPAFSLKYGARFTQREIDFKNLEKNACQNPP